MIRYGDPRYRRRVSRIIPIVLIRDYESGIDISFVSVPGLEIRSASYKKTYKRVRFFPKAQSATLCNAMLSLVLTPSVCLSTKPQEPQNHNLTCPSAFEFEPEPKLPSPSPANNFPRPVRRLPLPSSSPNNHLGFLIPPAPAPALAPCWSPCIHLGVSIPSKVFLTRLPNKVKIFSSSDSGSSPGTSLPLPCWRCRCGGAEVEVGVEVEAEARGDGERVVREVSPGGTESAGAPRCTEPE